MTYAITSPSSWRVYLFRHRRLLLYDDDPEDGQQRDKEYPYGAHYSHPCRIIVVGAL